VTVGNFARLDPFTAHPETPTPTPADFPQSVSLASGRPVLVVPCIGGRKSLARRYCFLGCQP
jgi:hypothetical protein